MAPSATKITQQHTAPWLINRELDWIWKEAVSSYWRQRKITKHLRGMAGVLAKIRSGSFLSTSQARHYFLSSLCKK
jgi:hypothetical protein